MRVLVVNAGSSSLKLDLLDGAQLVASEQLEAPQAQIAAGAVAEAVPRLGPVDAVGHRIVHGGRRFSGPVRVDDVVVRELEDLADLAPLHQAKSLAALRAVTAVLPDPPAVACFDTAFHATLAPAAHTYALPSAWGERWGLRRYGFHGLAHASVARRATELLDRPLQGLRLVTCHLGGGASLAAIQDGRCVDTTMGFTPLDGLVMQTRSGSVDPGLLLWLLEHTDMTPAEVAHALEHKSGVLALAGTADMREVVRSAGAGERRAVLALAVYVHRLRAGIAAMAAALGGLDALAFSGGVGENAAAVRAQTAEGLAFLGVALDPARDLGGPGDRDISAEGARVRTLVVAAREDQEIARQVGELLAAE